MEMSPKEYGKHFYEGEYSMPGQYNRILSPMISEQLGMSFAEKGSWWYGEWENHRRKVINAYAVKGMSRLLKWGYNYDFIPQLKNGGGISWSRTTKAFSVHAGSDYRSFIEGYNNIDQKKYLELVNYYELPVYTDNTEAADEYAREVLRRNIPFICEWFERVDTDDKVIEHLERIIPRIPRYEQRDYQKNLAFLLARTGRYEEAEKQLEQAYEFLDRNGDTYKKLLVNLEKASKLE